ncbi:HAMP domain-containing sensor histidine kinase [Lapidilactobacillus bayanensis]|uniref:HAMP domain-containing sensor histidine kinase n=1 Tax=Lapidilactobacillus bayanensis TaxID=2485998 RepID=UPI000F7B1003|nr:HAMP domain-containing histidine kinase [Lapidilactobacillus bayanensis]
MAKKEKTTEKKRFRLTLRVKWSVAVGLTIFLTFIIFAGIMYASFYNNLINQEEQTTKQTGDLIVERLSNFSNNLKSGDVMPLMTPEYDSSQDQNAATSAFQDTIMSQLSRSDMTVQIYDRDGQQLFSSQQSSKVTFRFEDQQQVKIVRKNGHRLIVATMPVYAAANHQLIGYVFIVNSMDNVRQSTQTLRLQMFVLGVVAVLFSALIGYVIAYRLSKRINVISNTIEEIDRSPESAARIPKFSGNDEINDLATEFNQMLDQVQRYIEQQKQFVGDVSHELRTPVAVIEGHLNLLNRWGKDDPEVLNESLQAAAQEAERMNSLIEEMLQLTRAEQVESKHVQEVTDVREVIMGVIDSIQMLHQDFAILSDVEMQANVSVRMNRSHLEQILIILLDNAVKYSTDRKEIHLSADTTPQAINIIVQDFGLGISLGNQQRIFDRFYRVDKARSRERGGNGLGLSIAYRLVKAYGGELVVDSVEGSGSMFKVTLPIVVRDNGNEDVEKDSDN